MVTRLMYIWKYLEQWVHWKSLGGLRCSKETHVCVHNLARLVRLLHGQTCIVMHMSPMASTMFQTSRLGTALGKAKDWYSSFSVECTMSIERDKKCLFQLGEVGRWQWLLSGRFVRTGVTQNQTKPHQLIAQRLLWPKAYQIQNMWRKL